MPKIKEKRDAVAGKMADLLEEIGNDRDGSRILHLSSPIRIMNAQVNIIERKDGQIALNNGKRPDYFLSDMTDRELDSLYRSLTSTELTSDKAWSKYLNNFVVDSGRQKVELPPYSNLEATLKDTGEKLHVDWLRSVKTASEGTDGIMRFPLYLGSYGDGAHQEQKEITLDDLDFDGLRAFEGNFRKMTDEMIQSKGQEASGGSRARLLDDDHTFVGIMV